MKKKPTPREVTQAAIKKCVDNNDRKIPGWSEKCYALLMRYIRRKRKAWMCENFRKYCEGKITPPDDLRAFGGVIQRASFHGLIKKIRIDSVKTPSNHMANAGVWMATGK